MERHWVNGAWTSSGSSALVGVVRPACTRNGRLAQARGAPDGAAGPVRSQEPFRRAAAALAMEGRRQPRYLASTTSRPAPADCAPFTPPPTLLEGHLHRRCGGRYVRATEMVTLRVSGMAAQVERVFFRCDKCGDERRTVEQRESAEQSAVAVMREEHQLLAPRAIRQLRDRLGLTPQQLGDLLYGIPRGIVEGWERGRYVQNPQVDALLRSLEDRETLERRAARAGVALPRPEGEAATGDGSTASSAGPGDAANAAEGASNGAADPPAAHD